MGSRAAPIDEKGFVRRIRKAFDTERDCYSKKLKGDADVRNLPDLLLGACFGLGKATTVCFAECKWLRLPKLDSTSVDLIKGVTPGQRLEIVKMRQAGMDAFALVGFALPTQLRPAVYRMVGIVPPGTINGNARLYRGDLAARLDYARRALNQLAGREPAFAVDVLTSSTERDIVYGIVEISSALQGRGPCQE